jgi:hypothetical protein
MTCDLLVCCSVVEYDTMDLEMLREVVPMLRQQLEKSMFDRNYVQLERVSERQTFLFRWR